MLRFFGFSYCPLQDGLVASEMIKGAGVIFISMIGLMIGYLAQLGLMIGPMSVDWEAGLGCQRLESRRPEIGRPDLGVKG